EFDPQTLEVSWEFPDDTGERLYSSIYGSQQRLPNGNTLISESNNGRILEVTESKDIVWEYMIPERKVNYLGNLVSTVIYAERFNPEDLPFLQD
ncbi:MAG: arylsulfotransferase family protein, partial [Gammaproteobacteria bacterium]